MLDDGRLIGPEQAQHLAPCRPSKIICVHTNYRSQIYEISGEVEPPKVPTFFQKPVSALNHHGGELILPKGCKFLNYEGELAAIVGRSMRNVTPDEVWQGLAGFSAANDVSLHDLRDADMGGMLRVKGVDGFCPVGPGIVWGQDIRTAILRSYLNGALVQECAIEEMIFDIDYLIADLARHISLSRATSSSPVRRRTPVPWQMATSSRLRFPELAACGTRCAQCRRRARSSATSRMTMSGFAASLSETMSGFPGI